MLYPIFLNIENSLAVVIGGGEVASRKVRDLFEAGARIKVIAPKVDKGTVELRVDNDEIIEILFRKYRYGDLEGASLVFATTSDKNINRRIYKEAKERGILINSVDDPPNCSFFVPSWMRRGDLYLAVSTGGASPAMAAKLRRLLEKCIPDDIEVILSTLKEARSILHNFNNLSSQERGDVLKKIVNSDELLSDLISQSKKNQIEDFLRCLL